MTIAEEEILRLRRGDAVIGLEPGFFLDRLLIYSLDTPSWRTQ
jgi:hypothetical protein